MERSAPSELRPSRGVLAAQMRCELLAARRTCAELTLARRRRQKSRLLPAETKSMSEKAPQATFSH